MSRSVDPDREQTPVVLPGDILHEIYAHAREAVPEECCGLVTGDGVDRHRRVHRCRNRMTQLHSEDPLTHPRDGREAFWIDPAEVLRVEREAETRGERVTAVYHSHVGLPAYLSAMDLEFADHALFPFPDADQIVVSVLGKRVKEAGLFRRAAPSGAFSGALIAHADVEVV